MKKRHVAALLVAAIAFLGSGDPRSGDGTYTLPASFSDGSGNPVTTKTVISSTWANGTLGSLRDGVTYSLSRSGNGGMLSSLRLIDGSLSAPGLAFSSATGTGVARNATSGDLFLTVGGVNVAEFGLTTKIMSKVADGAGASALILDTTTSYSVGKLLSGRNNGSETWFVGNDGTVYAPKVVIGSTVTGPPDAGFYTDGGTTISSSGINVSGNIVFGDPNSQSIIKNSGSISFQTDAGVSLEVLASGDVSMNSRRIIQAMDPNDPNDVATKSYVDTYHSNNPQTARNWAKVSWSPDAGVTGEGDGFESVAWTGKYCDVGITPPENDYYCDCEVSVAFSRTMNASNVILENTKHSAYGVPLFDYVAAGFDRAITYLVDSNHVALNFCGGATNGNAVCTLCLRESGQGGSTQGPPINAESSFVVFSK
jgi:hypothetical protein